MNALFKRLMQEARGLTQRGNLQAATAAIQSALQGVASRTGPAPSPFNVSPTAGPAGEVIDVVAREIKDTPAPSAAPRPDAAPSAAPAAAPTPAPAASPAPSNPSGPGSFVAGSFADSAMQRDYKLYVPPGADTRPMPLVVMLHGCTQNPDDFAAGTAMNLLAQAQGFFVLYPAQSAQANPQRCWNWFKHSHQQRGRGEPALLAGMTREVMARHRIDPARVFVAGLSAGGAMAAILAHTYPDLYAAAGVHSGLAAGAATDLPSALGAMRSGSAGSPMPAGSASHSVPTIVFHGEADSTVHPSNGAHVITASTGPGSTREQQSGRAAGGRSYTRELLRNRQGQVTAEHWRVQGAPHAWSGGSPQGSYTDPQGPDASAEMLRFFLAHPHN